MADYVSKGKVFLIHRDFPLVNVHPHAREAATWAEASARINKYEEVAAALFRQQAIWAANGKVGDAVAVALTPAEMAKVRALIKDPKVAADIDQDIALGQKANVNQTPT